MTNEWSNAAEDLMQKKPEKKFFNANWHAELSDEKNICNGKKVK